MLNKAKEKMLGGQPAVGAEVNLGSTSVSYTHLTLPTILLV